MSEGRRPTRWQKARADWRGFQWRDLWLAAVGLAIAVGVLALLSFPGKTVEEVAIVAGSGILAALVYALWQLVWAWLQAPMRLLTADVIAIRERLEAAPPARPPRPAPAPPNVRLTLLNFVRLGKANLDDTLAAISGGGAVWEKWTQEALVFLNEHVSAEAAEGFLTATDETGAPALQQRIAYLEELLKKRAEIE